MVTEETCRKRSTYYYSQTHIFVTRKRNNSICLELHDNWALNVKARTSISESYTKGQIAVACCYSPIYFNWLGPELFCPLLGPPGFNCWFSFAPVFQWVARHPRNLQVSVATRFCRVLISVSSQYLSVIYLFPLMIHWVRNPSCGPNNCMFWAMTEAEGEVGYP